MPELRRHVLIVMPGLDPGIHAEVSLHKF